MPTKKRSGSGGTSQYHELVTRDRPYTRTYKLTQQLAEDISYLASEYNVSSNDLAHWLLEEGVQQLRSGALTPKIEPVISRLIR